MTVRLHMLLSEEA